MASTPPTTDQFDPALSRARQSLLRFTALALADPRTGSHRHLLALRSNRLLDQAAALIRQDPAAHVQPLGPGERPLDDLVPGRLLAALPETPGSFEEIYEKTFGLLVSASCPPCETEYIDGKRSFQRSQTLADIQGFYRAFGLTLPTTHRERADHISLELEFVAFLVDMERRAIESDAEDRRERAEVCREAQARFLGEHLAWWAPAFALLLAKESRGGFYALAARLLAALVAAERGLLGVAAPDRLAGPSTIERPEACDGCLLSNEIG